MINDELIMFTLAQRMAEVRWKRPGDDINEFKFKTVTRRVALFNEVPSEQQPWCGQAEHSSQEAQVTGMPYKTTLECNWIVYQCVAKAPKAIGAIENNQILWGIRNVMAPKPTDIGYPDRRNTLGGLVYHCFISGRIFKDPGDIDGQGMMVVPIKLLVP